MSSRELDCALEIDGALCEVALSLDFLLAVTPVNVPQAWKQFHGGGYRGTPKFEYRALSPDLDEQRRRLESLPLDRSGDKILKALFLQKQRELLNQLECLAYRQTPRFLDKSIELYGRTEPALVELAEDILAGPRPPSGIDAGRVVGARTFARRAQIEIDYYRETDPSLPSKVQVLEEVPGVMAFEGDILIGREVKLPAERVEALIQHEVGTHMVTFANGGSHRLRLLQVGLAGYEETQEALAVFSEYVAGGLTGARLVQLAARVLAVQEMLAGESFTEVFAALRKRRIRPHAAFQIVARVFRGGGLTKDAIYLRGIVGLLTHLKAGGELDPLFIGKLPLSAVEVLPRLEQLGLIRPPVHRPRWATIPGAGARIAAARHGIGILDLVKEEAA